MFPLRIARLEAAFMVTVRDEHCESAMYFMNQWMVDSIAAARRGLVVLVLVLELERSFRKLPYECIDDVLRFISPDAGRAHKR